MDMNGGQNHLFDVVNGLDVAMPVTHTADTIHARPMAIAGLDEGVGAYLVTEFNSLKVDKISAGPHALLTFQSARKLASVRGEWSVSRDRQLIEGMWKEAWKAWFPQGKFDLNVALLKSTAHEGEYWGNAGLQGHKYGYDAAKAYATVETPNTDNAQHAKLP